MNRSSLNANYRDFHNNRLLTMAYIWNNTQYSLNSADIRLFSDTISLFSSSRQHSISDNGWPREPLYGGSNEGDYPSARQAWQPDLCPPRFMRQYKDIPISRIPWARQFGKVIARFEKNGSIHKQNNGSPTRSGRPSTTLASALRPALPPEAITLSTSLRRQGGTLRSSLGQSSEYYIFI